MDDSTWLRRIATMREIGAGIDRIKRERDQLESQYDTAVRVIADLTAELYFYRSHLRDEGRALHHIDGDPRNNDSANLEVVKTGRHRDN